MMCRLSIRSWSLGLCVALALLAPPARGESPKEAGAKSKAKAAAKKETEKKAPARQAKVKDAPAKKKGQEKTPAPSGGEKQKGAAEGATTTTPNESASKTQQQAAVGKTATVKQGPLKVEVKIDGYVESADGHEIASAHRKAFGEHLAEVAVGGPPFERRRSAAPAAPSPIAASSAVDRAFLVCRPTRRGLCRSFGLRDGNRRRRRIGV